MEQVMYQVSTLQALAMGYSRAVVSVDDFLENGDIGLGTFENVDGEMIMIDGKSNILKLRISSLELQRKIFRLLVKIKIQIK